MRRLFGPKFDEPKNEKAKRRKISRRSFDARSILPLFLKDHNTANGRNPRDDTLYARVASFVGDVLLRTTTPTFCFERRRRYPSEENNNGDSRVHRNATLLITSTRRATQSRDFLFHRQRVTTRLLFSIKKICLPPPLLPLHPRYRRRRGSSRRRLNKEERE